MPAYASHRRLQLAPSRNRGLMAEAGLGRPGALAPGMLQWPPKRPATEGSDVTTNRKMLLGCTVMMGLAALAPVPASANDELLRLQGDKNQWVMPTGNYANQRYSALDQINASNASKLHPVWSFSTGVLRGHEGGPLVIGDVMYVHTPFPNNVFALDLNDNGKIHLEIRAAPGSQRHRRDVLRHGQPRRGLWRRQDHPEPGRRHRRGAGCQDRQARSGTPRTATRPRARP